MHPETNFSSVTRKSSSGATNLIEISQAFSVLGGKRWDTSALNETLTFTPMCDPRHNLHVTSFLSAVNKFYEKRKTFPGILGVTPFSFKLLANLENVNVMLPISASS